MNPLDVVVAIVLPGAALLLALFVPLSAGMAAAGLVTGLLSQEWRRFVVGMLLTIVFIALALLGRSWAVSVASATQLAQGNQNFGIVFGTVTPFGVLLGLLLAVVTLVARYARRGPRAGERGRGRGRGRDAAGR